MVEEYKGGSSAFHPKMLLKAWILGYLYRIYTCRPLGRTLCENAALKTIFRGVVKILLDRGIIQGEEIFIDHTRMEANSNRHKMVWGESVKKRKAKIEEELDVLKRKIEDIQRRGQTGEHIGSE